MAFQSLSTGTSALIDSGYALDVVGQSQVIMDIPGYSRQRINQAATKSWTPAIGNSVTGNKDWTASIARAGNEYLEKRLRRAVSTDTYYGSLQNCYRNIQSAFDELTGNGLSCSMNKFWSSVADVSTHVEMLPARKTVIADAVAMTQRFNRLSQQLTATRRDTDEAIAASVTQINQLLKSIAQYNRDMVNSKPDGASDRMASDSEDPRIELIEELYQYMDVDTIEEENSSFTISLHGHSLVHFDQVKEIGVEKTLSGDGAMVNTPVFANGNYPLFPMDGLLVAQVEQRDVIIPSYQMEMDTLASNFIWEFNRIHSQTRGLATFDRLTSTNALNDPFLTQDQQAYPDRSSPGTLQITNGNFQFIVHNRHTDQLITINIKIDLDSRSGNGGDLDVIVWPPANVGAPNSLVDRLQLELDRTAPGIFEISIDSEYRICIKSNTDNYGFCFGKDTSGILAVLGLNVFFTSHDAASMGVNDLIGSNPSLLGGARSFNREDSDGIANILLLQNKGLSGTGGMTLDDYYRSVIERLASEASDNANMKHLARDIYNRMFVQRETLSGVKEDEEALRMLSCQPAFQSAVKFSSIIGQLYETLLNV